MPTSAGEAPGRVNLIGEHTDHQGGWVLPVALPHRARVEVASRADRRVRVESADVAGGARDYELGAETKSGEWHDLVQGVTAALGDRLERGFDARIRSEVPIGAGLGSSAAVAVALLRALRDAYGLTLDELALADMARRAETDFVGAQVGVMDQLASLFATEREALFIDTRTRAHEPVPLPADLALVVIDSGTRHRHASGAYNERRDECVKAARALGVRELRDVDDIGTVEGLPEPLRRRARHVVGENGRVWDAVAALRAGDLAGFGDLMDASHRSLRDDFEVSTAELDLLVGVARTQPGVLGARLVGGGFGGSIVAAARRERAREAAREAAAIYERRSGNRARIVLPLA